LYVAQVVLASAAADTQNGMAWGLSNRDDVPALPQFLGCPAKRHPNIGAGELIESLMRD